MHPLKNNAKDKIEIIKPDGRTFTCNNTTVQPKTIFIYCGEIPLEEGDTIVHKIDDNRKQEFIVTDRGYYNKYFGEHYQAKVRRKGMADENKNITVNIHGNNSHANINSIDNSINTMNISFNELRDELNKIEDEDVKRKAQFCLDELENSIDDETYKDKYVKFIDILSKHAEIIAPFIPFLTQFIQ